jgi:hypothetical protein
MHKLSTLTLAIFVTLSSSINGSANNENPYLNDYNEYVSDHEENSYRHPHERLSPELQKQIREARKRAGLARYDDGDYEYQRDSRPATPQSKK